MEELLVPTFLEEVEVDFLVEFDEPLLYMLDEERLVYPEEDPELVERVLLGLV